MEPVIQVEKLGKQFRIGRRERYITLRDTLTNLVAAPLRGLRSVWSNPSGSAERSNVSTFSSSSSLLWALRDVSFEIAQGERIGLIGRNGAGKSTLLKILARITRPTTGRAELRGRVGSLLEVGTGFHNELSGRENIFLSGAILGMRKREIQRKFDEILAFAGVEKFVDTPLKHYSTGMQLRLAFAVAAHLEPEILLVDEVLAVGDFEFQKKCLGKMEEVSRGGRTVIFVSHQMGQIRRLCEKVIWLDAGAVERIGPTAQVLGAYESAMTGGSAAVMREDAMRPKARFTGWRLEPAAAETPHMLESSGQVRVQFDLEVSQPVHRGHHGAALSSSDNQLLWAWSKDGLDLGPGQHAFSYEFPMLPLRPGVYRWQVSLWEDQGQIDLWDCLPEMIVATPSFQHARDEWNGVLNLPSEFSVRPAARRVLADQARV
jgi:lipopolysaccharide transport system ATP-binding protein